MFDRRRTKTNIVWLLLAPIGLNSFDNFLAGVGVYLVANFPAVGIALKFRDSHALSCGRDANPVAGPGQGVGAFYRGGLQNTDDIGALRATAEHGDFCQMGAA